MRLFLDTSVLLAACGSLTGASREIFRSASANHWILITTPYAVEEALRNLPDFPPSASASWAFLRQSLVIMDNVLTIELPVVFASGKDRPILFSALAWADILLTLDRDDFGEMMDKSFYDLLILKPGSFLQRERIAGRLL